MTASLFIYGTLLNPLVQKQVLGRHGPGEPDTLAGYKKYSIRLATGVYPIIRPETGGLVELALIDRYEGDAYQQKKVTLVSGRWAWVYQE